MITQEQVDLAELAAQSFDEELPCPVYVTVKEFKWMQYNGVVVNTGILELHIIDKDFGWFKYVVDVLFGAGLMVIWI